MRVGAAVVDEDDLVRAARQGVEQRERLARGHQYRPRAAEAGRRYCCRPMVGAPQRRSTSRRPTKRHVERAHSIWVVNWSEDGQPATCGRAAPLGFGDHVLVEERSFGWRLTRAAVEAAGKRPRSSGGTNQTFISSPRAYCAEAAMLDPWPVEAGDVDVVERERLEDVEDGDVRSHTLDSRVSGSGPRPVARGRRRGLRIAHVGDHRRRRPSLFDHLAPRPGSLLVGGRRRLVRAPRTSRREPPGR